MSKFLTLEDGQMKLQELPAASGGISQTDIGTISGRLRSLSPTELQAVRGNVYEVNSDLIRLGTTLTIDFNALTNVFREDTITNIVNIAESQNKHFYILLTNLGTLQASIVPDSEIANHDYLTNVKLLTDYYSVTPTIFDYSKNGYYKAGKRIIGTCRVNTSNEIDFYYDLGYSQRFKDVENLSIGNTFTETRWKREHPSCYIADGTTKTMSTDAPELLQIYKSGTLPNWIDGEGYFPRNISLSNIRALRNTQEDAFQGFVLKPEISGGAGLLGLNAAPTGSYSQTNVTSGTDLYTHDLIGNAFYSDGVNGTPRVSSETRGKNFAQLIQIVRG